MDKPNYTRTAILTIRQAVYDRAGRLAGFKHATCEVEFMSELSDPEFVGFEIVHKEQILLQDIETLGLSTRAETVARMAGAKTIGDLAKMWPHELDRSRGAGKVTIKECADALERVGLSLGWGRPTG